MAQERTLGTASALQQEGEDLSKEGLQRRMEEARESISETVTEIKETVALQVESVKDALDWREHFKKQPVAWSLGAMGVGFLAGYGLMAAIKGDRDEDEDYYANTSRPLAGERVYSDLEARQYPENRLATYGNGAEEQEGPGLFQRIKETSAFERLSKEAGSLGDRLVEELSSTAHTVVLPMLLAKVKHWVGLDLSDKGATPGAVSAEGSTRTDRGESNRYQPVLERPS